MAEVDAPAPNGKGQAGDSNKRQDAPTTNKETSPSNTGQMVVKMGEPGSIPMKVPPGQAPSNPKGSQPSSSKQQATAAAAGDPPKERIFLCKESMAKVKDTVALDKLLPPSTTRDDLRA